MESYKEKAKEISVFGQYDVIVVGGGCAGLSAAIAAARNGANTLIIERFGYFGGTATASLMLNINAFRNQKKPDYLQTSKGIAEEIILKMDEIDGLGDMTSYEQEEYELKPGNLSYSYPIDPEKFKYLTLKLVKESGADILFHTYFSDVIMEDDKLKGIIVENKSGRQAIKGDIIIDASGDADAAYKAGVPYREVKGDEEPRLGDQLMYRISGFDREGDLSAVNDWGSGPVAAGCMNIWGPSAPLLNGTNAQELTREEIETRLKIYDHFKKLKENNSALDNAHIIATGPLVGIRQTRFIEGQYKLTADDVLEGRQFDDVIALCSSPIINYYGYRRYLEHEGYDIPYRCLLPRKIDNLIVAGRCISSDQPSYESYRAMAPIMSIGEGAGTAAAVCIDDNTVPKNVDITKVQQKLKAQNAEIGQNRQ